MKREMLIGEPIRKFDGNGSKWIYRLWYAYIDIDGSISREIVVGDTEEETRDKMEKIAVSYNAEK